MTQPTQQQMENHNDEGDQVAAISVPWVVSLLQKVPIYIVAFACAYYLYQDNKTLNTRQIEFMTTANAKTLEMVSENGKMVMANTTALQALATQIEEGHKNLTTMDKVIYDISSTLHKIDQQTTKQNYQ